MENLKLFLSLININIKNNFRNPQKLLYLSFFSFLIVVIFAFSFDLPAKLIKKILPGIIWSLIILSSTDILSHSFEEESDNKIFYRFILSPVSSTTLLLTRIISNLAIIFIWEIFIISLSFIFLNMNFSLTLWFVITVFSATIGYVMLTTFFSLLISEEKNILMAVIIYPLILPLLMGALKMTNLSLNQTINSEFFFWLKIVTGFNVIYFSIIIIFTETIFENE